MIDFAFLAHFVDPFDDKRFTLVACDNGENCEELSGRMISLSRRAVLTFNASDIVKLLRRLGEPLPTCLVDIGDGLKLNSGLSRDDGGEPHWNVWEVMKPFFRNISDCAACVRLAESRAQFPEPDELNRLLSEACLALRALWKSLEIKLIANQEYKRFVDVEIPVQQIFFARQYAGIYLDSGVVQQVMQQVQNDKYTAFREVAAALNASPSGLSFRTIGPFLQKTDASHLSEFSGQSNFEDYFRIAQSSSTFAAAFLLYMRASRDLTILTGTIGAGDLIFPVYKCFGTVTGRILVANPRLQELRKRYRGVITTEPGKALLYLDYGQFEAGILASFAGDDLLRERYNSSDLYAGLSEAIFGHAGQRKMCKQMFLAYCFGMSTEKIAKLLSGADFSLERLTEYQRAVASFFCAFPKLEEYRNKMEMRLATDQFVSSLMGNRRVRVKDGPLTPKERRWAVNHPVQATASLIFKRALIDMADRLTKQSILLPMHDAILLQTEISQQESVKSEAVEIMRKAFTEFCPDVTPRVVAGVFANSDAAA